MRLNVRWPTMACGELPYQKTASAHEELVRIHLSETIKPRQMSVLLTEVLPITTCHGKSVATLK